jgi:hypothetical protein
MGITEFSRVKTERGDDIMFECLKCKELREEQNFYQNSLHRKDILSKWCKFCVDDYNEVNIENKILIEFNCFLSELYRFEFHSADSLCHLQNLIQLQHLENRVGVYFLYNKNKDLIYIGKSISLKRRMIESYMKCRASYYRYAFTKTESDMVVYELYYINKYKPQLNIDSNCVDELTITLPELKFSQFEHLVDDNIMSILEKISLHATKIQNNDLGRL